MKHKLQVIRTAHYFHEPAEGSSKGIIIAIHGYAQLAGDFINEFRELTTSGYDIYAPEALSKFYNKEQKPVANWMTSYEREDEINDYINYLEKFIQSIVTSNPLLPIHLIGFSQGVSTLLRWFVTSAIMVESIHLIAGSIPEEFSSTNFKQLIARKYYYYYGTQDRLINTNKINAYLEHLTAIGIPYSFVSFEGRHEVPKQLLEHFKNS